MALFARRISQPTRSSPASRYSWLPETYLTDGIRLFRTLSPSLAGSRRKIVAIEDCRTLEVIICPCEELAGPKLRKVAR